MSGINYKPVTSEPAPVSRNFHPPVTRTSANFIGSTASPVPTLAQYEAFCADYIKANPKTHYKSVWHEPKMVRRIVIGLRGNNASDVASSYGKSSTWVLGIKNTLPLELR